MKNFTLVTSFIIVFALCVTCWYILFWDRDLLLAFTNFMPRLYLDLWGKIFLGIMGILTSISSIGLFFLILGFEPERQRQVVLKNDAGSIGVSLNAIEEFLRRRCKAISGVRDLSVKTKAVDDSIIVETKLVLELQKNVPEFIRAFQERIRSDLEHIMGLDNVKEVRVLIRKIFPRDSQTEAVFLGSPTQLLLKEPDVDKEDQEVSTDEEKLEETAREEEYIMITETEEKGKEELK